MCASIRRRLRSEDGLTLVELIVGMWLGLIVLTAGLVFMVTTLHQSNAVTSRAVATRNAEAALQQLVRDLRESTALTISTSGTTTTASLSIPTPGSVTTPENVTWACTGTATSPGWCTRTIGTAIHTWVVGFESIAFTNLSGSTLTPPITTPDYLGITLNVQVTNQLDARLYKTTPDAKFTGSSNPIVIQTAVDLRNTT